MRVVSLVPSATETLRAWGVDPVAVTRFCEQPDLPTVGGTKNPDVAAIAALHPDLVIVDREENRREDADALEAAGVALHVLHITSLSDVAPAMADLAAAIGVTPVAADRGEVGESDGVVERAPSRSVPVWVPIWRRPWMAIGNGTYGSSLLAAAGMETRTGADGRYPETDLEQAAGLGVAWVLAPSEPYPFAERHRPELEGVAPVEMVDGKDLFWWGARTSGALRRLRALAAHLMATAPGDR